MTVYRAERAAGLLVCLLVAACSQTAEPGPTALNAEQVPPAASAPYQLNAEEKALDCKKLTGRMQVRILQVRDYNSNSGTSAVAQAMKKAVVATQSSGGSATDSREDYARDRAQLEAYNQQLAAMKCKTFNLEDELRPKPVTATPIPIAKTKDGVTITVPVDKVGSSSAVKSQ